MRVAQHRRVFVGRTDHIAALHTLYAEVGDGAARTLVIDGEAGVGKTTLVHRFLAELAPERVLSADGDESEAGIRFAIADQLLRSAGVKDADILHASDHVTVGMALLEQLSGASGAPPIVLVDDAHESDPDSLRALLFCARRLVRTAALIVLVVRGDAAEALPGGWIKLTNGHEGHRLHLGPLTAAQTRELGAQLDFPLSEATARRLWDHTTGNPLYTRAVLHELRTSATWPDDLAELPTPRSYTQLIEARLRRGSPATGTCRPPQPCLGCARRSPRCSRLRASTTRSPRSTKPRTRAWWKSTIAATAPGSSSRIP